MDMCLISMLILKKSIILPRASVTAVFSDQSDRLSHERDERAILVFPLVGIAYISGKNDSCKTTKNEQFSWTNCPVRLRRKL